MKNYNQSPLPFQGQKRRFIKDFQVQLQEFPKDAVYVDLFGGSGLLSHTVKQAYPDATVVWNDFDDFNERIKNVAATNKLIADIRAIVGDCEADKKVPVTVKELVLRRIQRERGFVDYITLSGSLLFSGSYAKTFAQLSKETFYAKVKQKDYIVDGYLSGVEVVREDYRVLYNQYKGKNVVFLLDPPYLSTDSASYNSDGYWKLGDYLNVLDCLKSNHYFYFTSNKSSIIELCEWMGSKSNFENPFAGATKRTVTGSVNYNSSYQDIMVCKKEG